MVNAPEVKSKNGASSSALTTQSSKGDARNRAGIANYTQHWKGAEDSAENTDARNASYKDVVNGYYDVSLPNNSLSTIHFRQKRVQTSSSHLAWQWLK